MFKTRDLLNAIDASGHSKMQQVFWRARLMDLDQSFFDQFTQPPQVLYKYIPGHRLDDALPDDGNACSFRATPPNELNDLNEINFEPSFVEDESNREEINRAYASALSELFPTSPVSVDEVENYRKKNPLGYGTELVCDQLSKRYGVTSFSVRNNDATMWAHYADDCRGLVVGCNVDFWVSHLVGTSIARRVEYEDELSVICGPEVVNQKNVYSFMASKGSAWAYEQEWRLITELSKTKQTAEDIAVLSVPQKSVSSVLVTDRTPKDILDVVVQRLNNPTNGYRISSINEMQRGRGGNTLAFTGQIKTPTHNAA